MRFGVDAGGSGNHGIYIDSNDYWYGSGNFSLGNGGMTWNGSTLSVTGAITANSGTFNGTINASAGIFTGYVEAGSGGMRFGVDAGGSGNHGIYIDSNDYWYGSGNFSMGNGNITWNGSTFTVTGTINANAGTFTGNVNVDGTLTAGTSKFGESVESSNDGLWLDANNYWYDTGVMKATSGTVGGWTLAAGALSTNDILIEAGTNPKLVFRDLTNSATYLTFEVDTISFSKNGGNSTDNVTTSYIKQAAGTDLILQNDDDDIFYVGPGRIIGSYAHSDADATLDDGVQEAAVRGVTANHRGNTSTTPLADNINAGVMGVNNRGQAGGLKIGVYGRANNHLESVGILGEAKQEAGSDGWSGVFRYRPFVVGDPFNTADVGSGALDDTSANLPAAVNATLMVIPNQAVADNTTTNARVSRVGIRTWLPSYELDVTGTIRATGNVIAYSDKRKKENIIKIKNGLSLVEQLRGVRFDWKEGFQQDSNTDKGKRQIGVIAQEVEKILPEVVSSDEKGFKSVNYPVITAVLIESVKDLKQIVDNQQKQIDELKKVIGVKNDNNEK